MRRSILPLVSALFLGATHLMAAPAWREIESAVGTGNDSALDAWVRTEGPTSHTAVNILIAVAQAGRPDLIDRLLARGVPVNATNDFGVQPILKAAEYGRTEIVKLLLHHGARASLVAYCDELNCPGHTPLIHAACRRDLEMARMLLSAGANPRDANDAATETAHQNGDLDLYRLLQQHGGRERPVKSPSGRKHDDDAASLATLGLSELLPANREINRTTSMSRTRLAVIADERYAVLGDLLTASLSTNASLELVERQELDRVLTEQKLTRQFAVDHLHFAEMAQLLRADALVLVQGRDVAGRRVMESRVLRVNPGLVLDTAYAPGLIDNAPDWAARLSRRVVNRLSAITSSNAVALSLLGLRSSVGLPEAGLDRTLTVMLADRLAREPGFVLLERAAMERLSAEKQTGGAFWTGSYAVDGTIEPALDGSGSFTLSVRFQPAGSGAPVAVSTKGRRSDPSRAIDEILTRIHAGLGRSTPPPRRHLADEAQIYRDEAIWLMETHQFAAAQSVAEAAWALGAHSPEVARLRVQAALYVVRDHPSDPASGAADDSETGSLDLTAHALAVWRETADDDLIRRQPAEIGPWLELGLEAVDTAVLATSRVGRSAEQIRHENRLNLLREICRDALKEIPTRATGQPAESSLVSKVAERQAALARFLSPSPAELLPAIRALMARHFTNDDALVRARVRAQLADNWESAGISFKFGPSLSKRVAFPLSRNDQGRQQVAAMFRDSTAPEDRFLSALMELQTAGRRGAVSRTELDRLNATLLGLRDRLAEGGEVFRAYFELFDSLDNLDGVPYFALTRHHDGPRMWERHTTEHSRFRADLFVAIATAAQKQDPQFFQILNRDDVSSNQADGVANARARLASLPSIARSRGSTRSRPAPATAAAPPGPRKEIIIRPTPKPTPPPQVSAPVTQPQPAPGRVTNSVAPANGQPLRAHRFWHPFNLGLGIPGDFRADFGSLRWLENRLWIHGSTMAPGGECDRHFLFVINPETLETKALALPQSSRAPDARFTVTASHILFSLREYLAVLDRVQSRWSVYPEIKPAGLVDPLVHSDRVYLAVDETPGNALISFDLKRGTTEILASSRRRPAVSPLDDPKIRIGTLASNLSNEIVITVGPTNYFWSPIRREWRAAVRTPQGANSPTPSPIGRVGSVRAVNQSPVLRLSRNGAPTIDLPIAFEMSAVNNLPPSRFMTLQSFAPTYVNSFPGGLLLIPHMIAPGFWIVSRAELEPHLDQSSNPALESVAK